MNETLKSKWSYRSFRHDPISMEGEQVKGNPELAAPWSPPGVLEVDVNDVGEINGKLMFTQKIILGIKGRIISATDKTPQGIELTGVFKNSVNKIKGFFIPSSDHVVGTILSTANDLGQQPVGTIGSFVLFPLKE